MAGNEPAVRLDTPTSPVVRPRTHFQVPAREMLLDEPICCPIYGALTFDGLAIDHEERVHLVVRTAAARAYLGPDSATVARRAHILFVALVDSGVIGSDRAAGIAGWLGECWSAAAEEISIAAATPPTGRDLMAGKHSGAVVTSTPRRRNPG